jgi:hypothetical protein
MKDVLRNLACGVPVFRFPRNQACLRVERGQFRHLLQNAVSYVVGIGVLYAEI